MRGGHVALKFGSESAETVRIPKIRGYGFIGPGGDMRLRPTGPGPGSDWIVSERDDADDARSASAPPEREPEAAPEPRPRAWLVAASYLPLLLVLGGAGFLISRLVWSNTAFLDESTYLYSGHQELAHLIHGVKIPEYESFFSGAPVLYPVLVAVADHFGGLAGARMLSMAFILLAIVALYLTARRMYGARAAFFAAGMFALLGPTIFLGSYATYDPMALCLMAWAARYAVSFAYADKRNALLLGTLLMALADCTKYACLLWNPVIIALSALAGPGFAAWRMPRRWNAQRFTVLWATIMVLLILAGRHLYFDGFVKTTLLRAGAHDSAKYVAVSALGWIGSVLAIALVGVLATFVSYRRGNTEGMGVLVALVLFGGGLLAPLNQIRIHTWLSLQKHADFGIWFSCIIAGALLAKLCEAAGPVVLRAAATVTVGAAALAPIGYVGVHQAEHMFSAWPDSTPLISTLRPYIKPGGEQYLVEDYDVAAYYLRKQSTWPQWHDLEVGAYTDRATGTKLSGVPAFQAAIRAHKYSVIVLDFAETPTTDAAVRPVITQSGYRLIARIPTRNSMSQGNYYVWVAPES